MGLYGPFLKNKLKFSQKPYDIYIQPACNALRSNADRETIMDSRIISMLTKIDNNPLKRYKDFAKDPLSLAGYFKLVDGGRKDLHKAAAILAASQTAENVRNAVESSIDLTV